MRTSRCSRCGQPDLRFLIEEIPIKSYSSPPPHLLLSNEAADEDIISLRRTLEDARRDKDLLERRIAFLEETLRNDLRNYHTVKQVVHDHHLVVSSFPIRLLPAEIILEIALMTIDSGSINILDCARGPWSMAQVSRRWREVLLHSPALWSKISINIYRSRPECAAPLLMTYLDRSGDYPLSISYQSKGVDQLSVILLGIMVAHSQRWKKLRLQQFSNYMLDNLRRAKQHRMDTLEELELSLPYNQTYNGLNIDVFSTLPRLRRLSVINFPNLSKVFIFPWAQLTYYSASQTHVKEHESVLRQTPNLVECFLISEVHQRVDTTSRSPKILNALRVLDLRGSAIDILRVICAPNLHVLRVEDTNRHLYTEGTFREFVSTCSSLRHLSIPSSIPPNELLNILQLDNFVTLEKLSLDLEISGSHSQVGAIMQILSYKANADDCILPQLKHLSMSIYCSAGYKLNIIEIFGMVESRWRMPETMTSACYLRRKLCSFKLELNHTWDPAIDQLISLRDEGLNLTLRLR